MDYEVNKKLRRSTEKEKEERGRDEEGRRMGFEAEKMVERSCCRGVARRCKGQNSNGEE